MGTVSDNTSAYALPSTKIGSILTIDLDIAKLWDEIFKYINRLHEEKIKANEEDIKQLDRYKWKR
ncbi:MAG: hypothetical protein FJX71_06930 [Alphaproteobacteria bacterium]|nr:hypothetical protein [Alphaproteobacteria bacterium]